jgi:hypothetical protein
MEMPSVYSPFKMDTSFHKMPFEEMGKLTELVGNTIKTNEQSISNFDTALGSLKTHPELMPELQKKVKQYQDLVEQSAGLAKTDPMRYLQIGSQLREAGRALTKDMTTGDISKYTNAYNQFNTSLATDLKDPKKNQNDVLQYYANKKNQDIANLRQGKEIGQASAPEYFNVAEEMDKAIKSIPDSDFIDNTTGQLIRGKSPASIRAAITEVENNPLYQNYIHSMNTSDPTRKGPTVLSEKDTNGGDLFYGKIRVSRVPSKDDKNQRTFEIDDKGKPVYKTDADGRIEYGRTSIKKDAMPLDDYQLQKFAEIYGTKYGGGTIISDAEGNKPGSSKSNINLPVVGSSPEQINNVTSAPLYVPGAEIAQLDALRGNRPSINATLADKNASPDERREAELERNEIYLNQRNAINRHNQLRDITFQEMNKGMGVSTKQKELLANVDNYRRRLGELNNLIIPVSNSSINKLHQKEYQELSAKYQEAKGLRDDYNSIYVAKSNMIQNNQANQNKSIVIAGQTDLQDAASIALLAEPSTLTIKGNDNKKSAGDIINTKIGTKGNLTDAYLFKSITPIGEGKVEIQAVDKSDNNKVTTFIISENAAMPIQEAIRVGKYGKTTKTLGEAITDPKLARLVFGIQNAPLPTSNINYGAVTEINYDGVTAYVRKTHSGGIIASIKEPDGSILVLPMITGSAANGELADDIRQYKLNPSGYKQIIESYKKTLTDKKESLDNYFVDPNNIHIFPTRYSELEKVRKLIEEQNKPADSTISSESSMFLNIKQ